MKKKYLKMCTALLSVAIVTSMMPIAAFASDGTETNEVPAVESKQSVDTTEEAAETLGENGETSENGIVNDTLESQVAEDSVAEASQESQGEVVQKKSIAVTRASKQQYETFKEAFPTDKLRESIRVILADLGNSNEYSPCYGPESIYLNDNTVLDEQMMNKLKNVTKFVFGGNLGDKKRLVIGAKDVQSIGKYFSGLKDLELDFVMLNVKTDELTEMFNGLQDLEGIMLYEVYYREGTQIKFPKLEKLKSIAIDFGYYYDIDISKLTTLTNYFDRNCNASNLDFSNNPNLESVWIESYGSVANDLHLNIKNNKKVRKINIQEASIISLDVDNNLKLKNGEKSLEDGPDGDRVEITGCQRVIGCVDNGPIDVSKEPVFDNSRVSNVKNATFENGKFYVTNFNKPVTYNYKCNDTIVAEFKIYPINVKSMKVAEGTVPTSYDVNTRIQNKAIFREIFGGNNYNPDQVLYNVMDKLSGKESIGTKGEIKVGLGYLYTVEHENIKRKFVTQKGAVKVPYEIVSKEDGDDFIDDISGGKWHKGKDGRYWYEKKDGSYPAGASVKINGNVYKFDGNGYMITGWQRIMKQWYYFTKKGEGTEGAMAKGWMKISGTWYYFYEDGVMASNTTIDGCYVNKSGAWVKDKWVKSGNRYWYSLAKGGYVKDDFKTINKNTYYFDGSGWMKTGWLLKDGDWYYFNKKGEGTEGAMVKDGWKKISGKWYYFKKDGKMAANEKIGSYYLNKSGVLSYDKWIKSGNRYWYSLKEGGYPKNDFKTINKNTYYFDGSGWMKTGWLLKDGDWYYFNKKGQGTEGAMAKNAWRVVSGKWYYFDKDGKMISDEIKSVSGKSYYFQKNGVMKSGWLIKDGDWYYFNKKGEGTEGAMFKDGWKKINGKWYYFYKDGKMAKNTVINGWKVNDSGAWVK